MSGEEAPEQAGTMVQDDAVAWLVRMQSDESSWKDWAALTAWLEASADHREAFARAEGFDLVIESHAATIAPELRRQAIVPQPLTRSVQPRSRRSAITGWALAASAILAAVIWRASEGTTTSYVTHRGETRIVSLVDGSTIRMNAASALTVRIGWFARRVTLGDAEAAFEVEKDSSRPFVVAVGDQQVRDVGTAFNIRHYGGNIVVTVSHGIVDVRQKGAGAAPVARLVAGQSLSHTEGEAESTRRDADAKAAYAWTRGRIVCDDRSVGSIVAELNRWYATPIRVTSGASNLRFSGVLELGDEATVARRLAAYLRLPVTRTQTEFGIG